MITDIRLQKFRSFADASFELSSKVNIIVGPNTAGKTNLLEAILVLSRGKSYRAKDAELIQFKKPWARIDGHTTNNSTRTVKIVSEPPSKTYEIDSKPYKRLSKNVSIPVVLFEPNDLLLLSGSPERRRDYLDDLLDQTVAGYSTIRRQHKRTLAQRNNLLKQSRIVSDTEMFPWNLRLSQLGGQIARARLELANKIDKKLGPIYKKLSASKTKVSCEYSATWSADSYETRMLKALENDYETDRHKGFTSAGPHREDLVVYFDERPIQETASRGEVRTAILALKIIELQLLEEATSTTPLLLLDDVFSELDGKRRHALTNYLDRYQTFITTTDADIVTQHFTDNCNVIALSRR